MIGKFLPVRDFVVFIKEFGVGGILEERVSPAIADGKALEVDVGVGLFVDVGADGGDVVAGIGFTSDVKGTS